MPREPGKSRPARSTSRWATPRRARSQASVSPVGPAPTMRTSVSVLFVTVMTPLLNGVKFTLDKVP
ncbi:protein of unknown function [Streptantibioticus cattleyicolor NRRL 8057 = DSM 46488]|nr:protein of unknown function [Streptantibioticus cattleyicolor NRRL 8057 = DSM 46488]